MLWLVFRPSTIGRQYKTYVGIRRLILVFLRAKKNQLRSKAVKEIGSLAVGLLVHGFTLLSDTYFPVCYVDAIGGQHYLEPLHWQNRQL